MTQLPIRCIAFDMEGPLTSQDAAFELMGLVPGGHEVFRAISRYDDILALAGRPDYEPGDTLALIVPFLLYHRLGVFHIERLAEAAPLVQEAVETIAQLASEGYEVFCITTTYQQYARRLAQRLGLAAERVACTSFPLEELAARLTWDDIGAVSRIESALRQLDLEREEERLQILLDTFYWRQLPGTPLGDAVAAVKPIGGKRKVEALSRLAASTALEISHWVVVGDSITDNAMLATVRDVGGLAVVFNGNQYALECGTVGVASMSLGDILPLLRAWEDGGLKGASDFAAQSAKDSEAPGPHYHWLAGVDITDALTVHARFRRLVRQQAASLG
ncbi:MAG: HAD family hydrolase [Dehalococcoidia bacterium]